MSRPPFFLLGAQRSGTTMLRLMLNQHPRLAIPHETAFMTVFQKRIAEYGELSERTNVVRLLDDISRHHLVVKGGLIEDRKAILSRPINNFPELIDAIMTEYAQARGKERWGDKTPFYTPDIDVLWGLFPKSKFVHLVRDGRDVLLSQRHISWLSNSVPRLAEEWRWKTTVCHKVGSVLGPEYFLELRYEDLVRKPEETLRSLCDFLEEPFTPDMLSYHETAKAVVPPGSLQWHRNSVKPPDPAKIFQWKQRLSVTDTIIFEQVAGATLEMFGYELLGCESTFRSKLKNMYYAAVVRW